MTQLHTSQKNADWTADEIMLALKNAGWSVRSLAAHHNLSRSTLNVALFSPAPRCEARIAEALGVPPQRIWPSRYDAEGNPNRKRGRPIKAPAFLPRVIPNLGGNHSTAKNADNVKARRAA